jgi:hypothetical protein
MLAVFGLSLAVIFGPNNDRSVHESNWNSHGGHPWLVGVLALELAGVALFATLAYQRPRPGQIRAALLGSGLAVLLIGVFLSLAVSN